MLIPYRGASGSSTDKVDLSLEVPTNGWGAVFGMGPQEATGINTWLPVMDCSVRRWHRCMKIIFTSQENGGHYDCMIIREKLQMVNIGIAAVFKENPFSFHASVYTQEELERVSHSVIERIG